LLYERKTYQINGKGEYNIGLYLGPRFYDEDWIQLVYELSHVVKDEVQVTHSDNYDDYYYYVIIMTIILMNTVVKVTIPDFRREVEEICVLLGY